MGFVVCSRRTEPHRSVRVTLPPILLASLWLLAIPSDREGHIALVRQSRPVAMSSVRWSSKLPSWHVLQWCRQRLNEVLLPVDLPEAASS